MPTVIRGLMDPSTVEVVGQPPVFPLSLSPRKHPTASDKLWYLMFRAGNLVSLSLSSLDRALVASCSARLSA